MEVVKEFYPMTTIYMHSSLLDVSAWLHGFSIPNQHLLPVFGVNKNQALSQLCFITGASFAEWVTSLFATLQHVIPLFRVSSNGKRNSVFLEYHCKISVHIFYL
jgi:hypothetical protein